MTSPISFEQLDISLTADMTESTGRPTEETPFQMLILGDFSGRSNRQAQDPGDLLKPSFRPLPVDLENLDQLMNRLKVQLLFPALKEDGTRLSIIFQTLEDFHPDFLVRQGEALPALVSLHKRLGNPSTFQEASTEMQAWGLGPSATPPPQKSKPEESIVPAMSTPQSDSGDVLARMLEENPSAPPTGAALGDERSWQRFVEDVVAPYLVPDTDPRQPERLTQVEHAMGDLMRTLVHHTDFQHLEAAWQGLAWLTQRLELSTQLKLFVLDISKAELAGELAQGNDYRSNQLAQVLIGHASGTPMGPPWAVVAGNYTFDQTPEDITLLETLAKIAQHGGVPFLSHASSQFIGCQSLTETPDPENWQNFGKSASHTTWQELRNRPEAAFVGLALPRWLIRLPYGAETEPVKSWPFEEQTSPPTHENYLWGNPIFACLELIGKAFMEESWHGRPGLFLEVEGLPLHIYTHEGESRIQPCGEVLLTERAAEIILERGLMPLLTLKDQDIVRLARFQSIAQPLRSLAGRWL
ncbi:MAG: type VI secretion system contractile sheath large subunit [Nitrospirales bacterium]